MVYRKRKRGYNHNLQRWRESKKEAAIPKATEDDSKDNYIEPRKTRLQSKLINPVAVDTNPENSSKRKKSASQNKYTEKTVVIEDEEDAPIPFRVKNMSLISNTNETLDMQYWKEELTEAQLDIIQKREKEYNEVLNKLDQLSKQQNGEMVYKGDKCIAYQINGPVLQTGQSNGILPSVTYSGPKSITVPENSVVLQKTNTPNTVKLVMDPRLGFIVGSLTPTSSTVLTPVTPVTSITSVNPKVYGPASKKARIRATPLLSTPPLQKIQAKVVTTQTIQSPQLLPATQTATYTTKVRATESTSIGGISVAKPKLTPTAIVDLTNDESRPVADSREIAFNKLQGRTFPSLVVVARPHLRAKEVANINDRPALDTKVKSVLVHTPTKFTEWLIQQGLIKAEQHCEIHTNNKLNLGMYSDMSRFPYSGGYVWISECCPNRFVSVFHGSIFEGAIHPPTVLLKLIYHWACQTNIQNIVQWVKVDNFYVKGLFTWLRATCTIALQTHIKPLGGFGQKIEVGVISLGTTSLDGSQRQVKVEVLGLFDPENRIIRLRAVEPVMDSERNYKRRFSKILEPLSNWVHRHSTIATDLTVDKITLNSMGFKNVVQTSQNGSPNHTIMEYLRKIVPRMFQNTLSLLSIQIIQQFLDELVWRETFGATAAQAFDNIVLHLAEQTRILGGSVIQRLNKIAAAPFKDHTQVEPNLKRRKRILQSPSAIIDLETIDDKQSEAVQCESVPLETYYFGSMDGDKSAPLAQKVTLNVRCCVCKIPFTNNIDLLDHLLAHAHNVNPNNTLTLCRYCLSILPTVDELTKHILEMHPIETNVKKNKFICLLCEQNFSTGYLLGKHMSKEHVPLEMPYQCGTCNFKTSNHRYAIDHFYKEHNGATALQCPFCLKSTSVWSADRIMSTNVTFFLTHLQKHQKKSMAKKCPSCALWFIHKETLKDHQQKAHQSMIGMKGIKCWPLPTNNLLVPKSKLYTNNVSLSYFEKINPMPLSIQNQKVVFKIPQYMECMECNCNIDDESHFPQKMSCSYCNYVTNCLNSIQLHKVRCRRGQIKFSQAPLSSELHCICGYSSNCGNQMAKHMALCERKTAYPSAEEAKIATINNSHSMLDVLGLVRRNDDNLLQESFEIKTVKLKYKKPSKEVDKNIIILDDDVDDSIPGIRKKDANLSENEKESENKNVDQQNLTDVKVEKEETTVDVTIIEESIEKKDTIEEDNIDDVTKESIIEIEETVKQEIESENIIDEKVTDEKIMEENVTEKLMEENVNEKLIEENVNEKLIEENVTEKLMKENVNEKLIEENVNEKLIEENVNEKLIEENITERLMEENVTEKLTEENVTEKELTKEKNEEDSTDEKKIEESNEEKVQSVQTIDEEIGIQQENDKIKEEKLDEKQNDQQMEIETTETDKEKNNVEKTTESVILEKDSVNDDSEKVFLAD